MLILCKSLITFKLLFSKFLTGLLVEHDNRENFEFGANFSTVLNRNKSYCTVFFRLLYVEADEIIEMEVTELSQDIVSSQESFSRDLLSRVKNTFVQSTQKNEKELLENSSLFDSEEMEQSYREFLLRFVSMTK